MTTENQTELLTAAGVLPEIAAELIEEFSEEKIRRAVWYCTVTHSYGPGGVYKALKESWDIWPHEGDREKVVELLNG